MTKEPMTKDPERPSRQGIPHSNRLVERHAHRHAYRARGIRPWLVQVAVLCGLGAPGALGCGGAPPAPVKPVPAQHERASSQQAAEPAADEAPMPPPFLHAAGTGATEEEAYEHAVAALAEALYGSPEDAAFWAVPEMPLHDPAMDPLQRTTSADGRVRVEVGLERERVEALLLAVLDRGWEPAAPAPLADALRHAYRLHVDSFVCARNQVLLEEPCLEPPGADDLRAADDRVTEALANEVRLQPFYAGGVPVDAEERPLRPLRVVAERALDDGTWVPMPGLSVRVTRATGAPDDAGPAGPSDAQPEARSDAQDDMLAGVLETTQGASDDTGMVSFAFVSGARWPGDVRVFADTAQLLGPLARLPGATWPAIELDVPSRTPGMHRWSMVVTEQVQGQVVDDGLFATTLSKLLRRQGAGAMVSLPADVAQTLQNASPDELTRTLPALADTWAGTIDVLLIVKLDSEYASRMDTRRVWYEARGRIEVRDVWTGKRLDSQEGTATAFGVGDERADRAARSQLAEKLASQLMPSS